MSAPTMLIGKAIDQLTDAMHLLRPPDEPPNRTDPLPRQCSGCSHSKDDGSGHGLMCNEILRGIDVKNSFGAKNQIEVFPWFCCCLFIP